MIYPAITWQSYGNATLKQKVGKIVSYFPSSLAYRGFINFPECFKATGVGMPGHRGILGLEPVNRPSVWILTNPDPRTPCNRTPCNIIQSHSQVNAQQHSKPFICTHFQSSVTNDLTCELNVSLSRIQRQLPEQNMKQINDLILNWKSVATCFLTHNDFFIMILR